MSSNTYSRALDSYLSAYDELKRDIKTIVMSEYGLDMGNDFLQYGNLLSTITAVNPNIVRKYMMITNKESDLSTASGAKLYELQKKVLISSDFVTDLKIDSFGKFKFWFLSADEIRFPNLSSIEYGENISQAEKDFIENKLGYNA